MDVAEKFSLGKFLKGFVSKKLIIWLVATVALFWGLIDGTWWGIITAAYLGVNVTQDFIMGKLKEKHNGISNLGGAAGGEHSGPGGGAAKPSEGPPAGAGI